MAAVRQQQTATVSTKSGPRVMQCKCSSEFQDARYGRNLRVHNACSQEKFRCTVCGNLK